MATIVAVDDEAGVLFMLREILEEHGHVVHTYARAQALLESPLLGEVDLVLTDYAMPELDGLELVRALVARDPTLPVVLLTARGSERLAVAALKAGAYDYLPKPFALEELEGVLARALELGRLRREARRAAAEGALGRPLIGQAPAFRQVVDQAVRLAPRDVPVLVYGQTGTGKELLAALLHAGSTRARGPLVRFSCAAITESLAESELFGHGKGAFTGATAAHRGYFARAHGGTLVLDEIGELPLALQPKLLRALQSGELQPVGASAIEHVDVRVVACTHRDLRAEVEAGRFRADLYYRLSVVELTMPPLDARRSDIPLLATVFAQSAAARFGLEGVSLSTELLEALSAAPWPGNVRELENVVTRLVALSDGGRLEASAWTPTTGGVRPGSAGETRGGTFREQVELLERTLLTEALSIAGGNQSEAARRLGLSRATFLDKLKRLT